MKPKIRYDYNEGVWYIDMAGLRSAARSRSWRTMLDHALALAYWAWIGRMASYEKT